MQAGQIVWLEWSGAGGASGLTGAFGPGGPGGTATATRSGAIDGAANGVPGALASSITTLTPTFQTYYGTGNPGTGLTSIANNYNDAADRYVMTLDFTTLTGGVLKAGSLFAFADYDISESLKDLTGFTTGGAQLTAPWLSLIGGPGQYIDASTVGGDSSSSMPVAAPTVNQLGGVYQVGAAAGNMDVGFLVFRTTADLTRISYEHFRNTGTADIGGGGGGIAIGSEVPEPQALGLAALGLGALWLRNRRRSIA